MVIRTAFNMGFGALVGGSSDFFLCGLVSSTVFNFSLMNPSYLDILSWHIFVIMLYMWYSHGISHLREYMFSSQGSYSVPLEGQVRSTWNQKKKKRGLLSPCLIRIWRKRLIYKVSLKRGQPDLIYPVTEAKGQKVLILCINFTIIQKATVLHTNLRIES